MAEKKEDQKVHMIYDDPKFPNGRHENAEEREARLIKENEEKNSKKVSDNIKNLVIPKTKMLPAPMRIYVLEVRPDTTFLNKGLDIVLAHTHKAGPRGEDIKSNARFFCVATGDEVDKQTFKGKKLEPGDEVVYMDIPDAVRAEIPVIQDYELADRTGKQFYYKIFDVMEIAGIIKRKKEKKEKSA